MAEDEHAHTEHDMAESPTQGDPVPTPADTHSAPSIAPPTPSLAANDASAQARTRPSTDHGPPIPLKIPKRKLAASDIKQPDPSKKPRSRASGYQNPFTSPSTGATTTTSSRPPSLTPSNLRFSTAATDRSPSIPIDPQLYELAASEHEPAEPEIPASPFVHARSTTPASIGQIPPPLDNVTRTLADMPHIAPAPLRLASAFVPSKKPRTVISPSTIPAPIRRTPGPSSLASPAAPAPVTLTTVSQALRDRLSELEESVSRLETAPGVIYAPAKDLATLQDQVIALEDGLEHSSSMLRHRLGELAATQVALEQKIDTQAQDILELRQLMQSGPPTSVKSEQHESSADRDNIYNSAFRNTILVAMGLAMTTPYKDAAQTPVLVDGGGWVTIDSDIPDAKPTRVLRPDWTKPWKDNTGWHVELVEFMRAKISQIQPLISAELVAYKTDQEILTKLGLVYKAIRQNRPSESIDAPGSTALGTSSASGIAGGVAPSAVNSGSKGRRKARKQRKSEQRRAVLTDPKVYNQDLVGGWTWALETHAYMSTDESAEEESARDNAAIDPDSEDDAKPRTHKGSTKRSTPWTTRPPTYRGADFQQFLDELDEEVMSRAENSSSIIHARVKGRPKDVPLPRLKRSKKLVPQKIPRSAVDPVWLADHPTEVVALRKEDVKEEHNSPADYDLDVENESNV
ncbi:hypothetical protein BD626DRAFT_634527 [Schizophyllum amplum]|uniref:Uncharacterized protein n=1 Tax=Schizophyllum amplum TaxID=97359 RepID=A0A550BZA1_9AGAR|nr:hypothetical protein BD626DRAFT_634527 [Auriculariopsis ampla]